MKPLAGVISPLVQFLDGNGNPLGSGTIAYYLAGTKNLADVFADAQGITKLVNPVGLDASGYLPNLVYCFSSCDMVLSDGFGNQLENWSASSSLAGFASGTSPGVSGWSSSTEPAVLGEARGTGPTGPGVLAQVVNLSGGAGPQLTPYSLLNSPPVALLVESGGGEASASASAYVIISANGSAARTGILFLEGSVPSGAPAIALAQDHLIQWYNSSGAIGPSIGTGPAGLIFGQGTVALAEMTPAPISGNSSLLLLVNNPVSGLALAPVSLGPVDSAGTGFRALRVPN